MNEDSMRGVKLDKRRADELTNELASQHFPLWSDPERYEELAHALRGKSAGELAGDFGRVETMLQALENYADETGDLAASLDFEGAKHGAMYARRSASATPRISVHAPCRTRTARPNTHAASLIAARL